MKMHRSIIGVTAALLALAAFSTQVPSQQNKGQNDHAHNHGEGDHGHDMAAMMPGPEHAKLGKYVGDFETTTTMSGPGMPAAEPTKGTSVIKSKLEGRFFMDVSKGEMMGQPYESIHYYGYNSGTGEYEANWTYTMSTSMLNLKGKSEDGGKTIKLNGTVNEGAEEESLVVTLAFIDDDNFSYELSTPAGDQGPVMKTTYKRKK